MQVPSHNHAEDDATITRVQFVHDVKRSVKADPSKPIRRAYNEALRGQQIGDSDEEDYIPEFHSVRTSIARKRQSMFPSIPRKVKDVTVKGRWAKNWQGQPMICHQDNRKGLLMFMSSRNAYYLRQCDDIYIDGTFKSCPKPYLQILSIHGMFHGRVVPFAFILLKSKANPLYVEMFKQLKQNVLRLTGHNLVPKRILSDFETSLIQAASQEFPQAKLSGLKKFLKNFFWQIN